MNSAALVSVIIPNYNHAPYLSQRIESVLNQTYKHIEVIILDDCSLDNSVEVIEQYQEKDNRISFYKNETNSGSTFKQWNKAFGLIKGDWIWVAESDDYCTHDFLEILLNQLIEDESELIFCDSNIVDDKGNNFANSRDWHNIHKEDGLFYSSGKVAGKTLFNSSLSQRNLIVNASSAVFSKGLLEKVGGRALEDYKMAGDWHFWATLAMAAKYVSYNNNSLNFHRRHQETVTNKKAHVLKRESISILKSNFNILEGSARVACKKNITKRLLTTNNWSKQVVYSKKTVKDIFLNLRYIDILFLIKSIIYGVR